MKKRIISFLLALVMAVSLLPVSAFAVEDTASPDVPAAVAQEVQTAEAQQDEEINTPAVQDNSSTYVISFSTQETIGTVVYNSNDYPLFYIKIGNTYTDATLPKKTGKLGGRDFPVGLMLTDESGSGYIDFALTNVIFQYSDDNTYFAGAKKYYSEKLSDIKLNDGITLSSENGTLLLLRLKGSGRIFNQRVGAFAVIQWDKPTGIGEPLDKSELNAEIAKVTGENAVN